MYKQYLCMIMPLYKINIMTVKHTNVTKPSLESIMTYLRPKYNNVDLKRS